MAHLSAMPAAPVTDAARTVSEPARRRPGRARKEKGLGQIAQALDVLASPRGFDNRALGAL